MNCVAFNSRVLFVLVLYDQWQIMVQIPKPMGVRKGWIKQLAVICDFKVPSPVTR